MNIKSIYKVRRTLLALITTVALSSCDDYLDTIPSKGNNEVLNNSAQVEALLGNSSIFNTPVNCLFSASDDEGMGTDIADMYGYVSENILNEMTWNTNDNEVNTFGDGAWDAEYNKVFTANLIINQIDEVKDLSPENRTEYLAQAHLMRAMAMWALVNSYCLPYSEKTLSEPGLPLKKTNSYEEPVPRATVKETYDFILADLNEAMKTHNQTIGERRWWVSQPAVKAMMARYYLFTQDYDKAAQYAKEALESSAAELQDYNELGFEPSEVSLDGVQQIVNYSELYRYSDSEQANYEENYLSEYFTHNEDLIPSESLKALYDQENDLRYKQFFNKYALWSSGIGGLGDDMTYNKFSHKTQAGPTVAEMLLTEAEALARTGQWQEAMRYVNELREKRYVKGSDFTLTADNQEDAIKKIIDERHREMPFLMRWYDIRRLGFNDVEYDDVSVEHVFYDVSNNNYDPSTIYKYILPSGSARCAHPLSIVEINRSNGQIKQNEYPEGSVVKEIIEKNIE